MGYLSMFACVISGESFSLRSATTVALAPTACLSLPLIEFSRNCIPSAPSSAGKHAKLPHSLPDLMSGFEILYGQQQITFTFPARPALATDSTAPAAG